MEEQEDEVSCQDHILTSKWLTLCYPDSLGEIINVGTDPCYIVAYFFFSDGSYSSKIPMFPDFNWLNKQRLQMKELMIRSDQIRSVTQSCPTLCDPMNCSTPGLPVHHQLLEFTQTHVH